MPKKIVEYLLTKYSHGAGCGCKISPSVLSEIIGSNAKPFQDSKLIVGNESSDDAAVVDLGNGTALISTTDFFMPIVDDPYTFGRIAAANAISDVYAMGGKPIVAIAILGWPVEKIPAKVAQQVLEGGRSMCTEAGISLAGGHSIDSPEPIFGLAVNGLVSNTNIKKNDTATEGCHLLLTKPLGVGVLSTAQKQGKISDDHKELASEYMTQLNKIGADLAEIDGVKAMTDVTGFGLLGHLLEICEGSGLNAEVEFDKIPVIPEALEYIEKGCIPGGTIRNWESYGSKVSLSKENQKLILCDPQTSGGLLVVVEKDSINEVQSILGKHEIQAQSFGKLIEKKSPLIVVN